MRTPLAATLAIGLAFGCNDQPTTPTVLADGAIPAPAFNFRNNPDNGNPSIVRSQTHVFFVIFQFPAPPPPGTPDLFAIHSTTPDCGGILEPADLQQVLEDPDDPTAGQIRELTLADPINIFILDFAQPGSCFGFKLVASGTGKLVNTDNDLFVFLRPNNNANAFGFSAHGTLYGPGGEKAHYNGVLKFVWDGEDIATLKVKNHFNFRWLGS